MASYLTAPIISTIFLILLLGSICVVQSSYNDGGFLEKVVDKSITTEQREFDYFLLSLQWPGTYCRKTHKCCSQNGCCRGSNSPAGFTIHGLWADYYDGTWPSCCNGPEFDVGKISTLLDALEKYWPSLSCSSSKTCHGGKGLFWGHEWEKHGTCEYPYVKDEYDYFIKALHLYFKYNLTEVLSEAGYLPSNSEKYPLGGVISAVQNAFHVTPEVECSGDAVEEVRLCFYKDFTPRDCIAESTCPSYVSLPAYASMGLNNNGTATTQMTGRSSI